MTIFREDTIDLKNSVCGRCPKYTSMLHCFTEVVQKTVTAIISICFKMQRLVQKKNKIK